MNWEDERYVRLYVRDTVTWKLIGWQGRCLLPLLLRKVDRVGCADLDGAGVEGVAALVDLPLEVVEPGFKALLARGVIEEKEGCVIFPRFLEAQESKQSDRHRQAESRLRRRDQIRSGLDPDAREAVIYFVQSEHGGPIKIGRADDLAKRMVGLQTSRPDKLVVLAAAQGTVELERQLHTKLAGIREKGEWFTAAPELLELIRDVSSRGHVALSQFVTGHSVPSRTVPNLAVPKSEPNGSVAMTSARSPLPNPQPALLPDALPPQVARKTREPKPKADTTSSASALVWSAYAAAFTARYGTEPTRNARVNAQIAQFVGRVPAEEAPQIAAFYLRHSAAFYAGQMHSVGLLLRDAEKLRAEWQRGRTVNMTEARRNEQTAANPWVRRLAEMDREKPPESVECRVDDDDDKGKE